MKQIKYLSFIPFLALLCLMTGCENDKDVYYPYVNVPLTTHNPVLVEGEVLHIGIGLDGVNYRVESDNEDVVTAEVVGNEILLTGGDIGSTIVRLSDDSYNRALMTVEVRKLQELTLESLPEGVEVLRLDNDGVILREMKILTGNGGYTVTNSAPEAISAEIVEDPDVTGGYKLILGGKANVDQATITVTDSRNKSATLKVRVTNPIRPVLFDKEGTLEGDAVSNSKYGYNGQPQAYLLREKTMSWRNANTLTYDNKKLFKGRDKLNVLIGHEVSSSQRKSIENVSVAFPVTMNFDDMKANMGSGKALANQSTIAAKENILSFFGRVNYTMMDKYLLAVTVRADGSSKFGSGNRWGVFPSAALAWRISDEAFMSNTQDWLSALKLRLSFGTAGNNRINSGLLSTTYSLGGNDARNPFFNGESTTMLEHGTNLYNPDLKWETTVTRNIGIDYGFWNNRISGAIDFYWNTTRDLLMRTEIPSLSGYNYQYKNFGQTSNKGVELSVSAVLFDKKNFSLNFNANIAYNRNRIDKLNTDSPWQSSNWSGSTMAKYEDFRVEKGGRLGEVWGYKTNGYYTVYDPVTNPTGELVWAGSEWGLKDGMQDNSPTITGGKYYPGGLKLECDKDGNPLKQRLGNTIAPTTGGFGFDGRVGNFDFNVFFNYSLGNVIVNGTKLAASFRSGSRTGYNLNNDFRLSNRYTWIDPETGLNLSSSSTDVLNTYGDMTTAGLRLNEINANANMYNPASATTMQLTDYAVEKASFLRLNNITIGYSLPKTIVRRAFMQNVRIYLTGYNLFCWTNYSGADPEVDTSSKKNAMTPGIDYAAYPKSRTFVGGINVTF